jgi:YfiH family protein
MTHVPFISSSILNTESAISHGFFTRNGGVSSGIFDSLNCSQFSGDEADSIDENRKRVADTLDCRTVFSLRQIHSDRVCVVDEDFDIDNVHEGDGMVTVMPGIAISVLGADCSPVLMADPEKKVVGAAHGGWKGAVAGVTDNVISAMESLGARRYAIIAAIGPSIQKQSYQVGEEFVSQVIAESGTGCSECFDMGEFGQGIFFDLPLFIEKKLESAGVLQVDRLTEDTYSDENRFYSYRRACHHGDENYGRQISAIGLNSL